ncbi:MAG TPA: DUF3786 domain-containing protein [Candidatus Bathyarchaeia archaeon]|nr:DUF3786 domain-containing protein [Candidatus Bathyarchaeia archaeon]
MGADIWTWEKCKNKLKTLRGRLGFPDSTNLHFLKLALSLETGEMQDEMRNQPYPEAKPTIYCILSGYADAKPTPETKQLISYSQVPGGVGYNAAFIRRAVQPLERIFGSNVQRLWTAAQLFDAEKLDYGDCSAKIHALPLVPLVVILRAASPEFSASANMLFDSTISNYLSTEQVAMLSQLTALRLARANEAIT